MKDHCSRPMRLWARWTLFCTCGEIVGMAAAAGCAVVGSLYFGKLTGFASRASVLALMVSAGVIEGLSIGYFQWQVLRTVFAKLSKCAWVFATVTVAALGWFLGMLPSTFVENNNQTAPSLELPMSIVVVGAVILGAILGAAFGGAQGVGGVKLA